jgi:hypothetical protein
MKANWGPLRGGNREGEDNMQEKVKKIFRHGKAKKTNKNLVILKHPEGSFTETQAEMRKKAGLS